MDKYFWMDPWSEEGQETAAKIRPVSAEVRLDAERALTLLDQARAKASLRETDALDALDLGARRIDFLVFQFQTADQIAESYRHLYDGRMTPQIAVHTSRDLWNLAGINGRCEDLRDGYKFLERRFSSVWLEENRPFWLNIVTARYDAAAERWVERSDKLAAARDTWNEHHQPLPAPETIGIPPAPRNP
jgi:hypothetical protein